MGEPVSLSRAVANCLPRLRLYWKPLTFLCLPLSFLAGMLATQTAEETVKLASVVAGGAVLGFVAGLAAAGEQFKALFAGAPFATFGMFAGSVFALAGLSPALFGSMAANLAATALGIFFGLAAQRE